MQIARPYAQALFDIAQGDKSLDAVEQGLISISNLEAESTDFSRFLRSRQLRLTAQCQARAGPHGLDICQRGRGHMAWAHAMEPALQPPFDALTASTSAP